MGFFQCLLTWTFPFKHSFHLTDIPTQFFTDSNWEGTFCILVFFFKQYCNKCHNTDISKAPQLYHLSGPFIIWSTTGLYDPLWNDEGKSPNSHFARIFFPWLVPWQFTRWRFTWMEPSVFKDDSALLHAHRPQGVIEKWDIDTTETLRDSAQQKQTCSFCPILVEKHWN